MKDSFYMSLNSMQLEKDFATLQQFTGEPTADLIRDRSAMLARHLAEGTPPFHTIIGPMPVGKTNFDSGSLLARNIGRSAVARDIRSVYEDPRKTYRKLREFNAKKTGAAMARVFWKAIKNGQTETARQVLVRSGISAKNLEIVMFDGGERHKRYRQSNGRVNDGVKPVMVANYELVKAYSKKIEDHVGWDKAAWINAAKKVSTVGMGQVNKWIWKHIDSPGYGEDRTRNTKFPTVQLTNGIAWASESMPDGFQEGACRSFENALRNEIAIRADYWIKKAGMNK